MIRIQMVHIKFALNFPLVTKMVILIYKMTGMICCDMNPALQCHLCLHDTINQLEQVTDSIYIGKSLNRPKLEMIAPF